MWNEFVRSYFFNGGQNEDQSDALFLDRYCSNRTVANINSSGINSTALRKVLNRLTTLVPSLSQSTPGWSIQNANMLIVVFGSAHLQWRPIGESNENHLVQVIRRPRFGLCGKDGSLFFWTDENFLFDIHHNLIFKDFAIGDWLPWPGSSDGQYYFKTPLANANGEIFLDLLAENKPLYYLLQEFESGSKSNSFILDETLSKQREILGVPEEFSVGYPKLFSNIIASSKDVNSISKLNDNLEVSQGVEEPENLAMLAQARVDELGLAHDNDQLKITDVPGVVGRYYVYALIDPTDNNTPFYIGKGFHDRINQHFHTVKPNAQPCANYEIFDETESNSKEFKIGENSKNIIEAEEKSEDDAKIFRIRHLLNLKVSRDQMARVIARGLSESAAFAIEALLIKSVYGLNNLTNKVRGAHDERFRDKEDWNYKVGYDLPADQNSELLADNGHHQYGVFYVYVLRDPETDRIFYVGKGKGNRLCQHFDDARNQTIGGVERLDRLSQLLKRYKPKEIGRIIARVDSEAMAFIIESFYIKFVVGFRNITNIQPGHLSGMFRSNGDWEVRSGFDLPLEAGGMRRLLQDTFLGEGLDTLLQEVVRYPDLYNTLDNRNHNIDKPKLVGAGELAINATMIEVDSSVQLQIHVRSARRIQISLIPKNKSGEKWIEKKFSNNNLYPLRRADYRFTPLCWAGPNNVTSDPIEAAKRAIKLIKLAQKLESTDNEVNLEEFEDLLTGLPMI